MVEYSEVNWKLTNVQLNKLGIRNFNKDERLHELLLITRQNTKLRNALNNNSMI